MTTPTWVLQTNISSEDSESKLYGFLTQRGTPVERFKLIPFDDSPLPFDHTRPTIFYGSTSLIRRAGNEDRFRPGVWYDLEASSFHRLCQEYDDELLNRNSTVLPLHELVAHLKTLDIYEPLFVRPTEDTKAVVGRVRPAWEWLERLESSIGVRGGPTPDTMVQMAEPQDIPNEWRVCILDGKPITASSYRVDGRLNQGGDIPGKVMDYAGALARRYSPQPVYMLDVCERSDGVLKVVETNTFNCSGFYWMDVYLIARKVTDYVEDTTP